MSCRKRKKNLKCNFEEKKPAINPGFCNKVFFSFINFLMRCDTYFMHANILYAMFINFGKNVNLHLEACF